MTHFVFFMGAGFSAPFGLPPMRDFLRECLQSTRITQQDKALITMLQIESRRANAFLETSPANLEDILTLALMGDRLKLYPEDDGPRGDRVKKIIQRIYSTAKLPNNYWTDLDKLESLMGFSLSATEHNVAFITTNYDLILESALCKAGIPTSLPFPHDFVSDSERKQLNALYGNNGAKLCKLHGSVNWFEHPSDNSKVLIEGRVVRTGLDGQNALPQVCLREASPDCRPIIVPPAFTKPDMETNLRQSWVDAAKHLRNAHVLVFVGYSFPASDSEMRYFIASSLADNTNLQNIIIVDLHASEISARLRQPQSGYGSHFRSMIDPQDGDWTGICLFG